VRKIALPLACALALAGPFCFAPVSDSDTGWHVAIGRLVLGGAFPRTNALSWAWGDHPWYATSWLFDLLCAVPGTALGVQVLTFAFVALTLFALSLACETAWVVPGVALLLVPRIVPRPHVASWALLAAVLALAPRSTRARAACVALVALGGNLHSGAAFAAFVLALLCLEAWLVSRRRLELLLAVGAGVALLANPGVLFNARYLLEHLLHVDEVVQLREFEPPPFAARPAFYLLIPAALLFAVHRRREHPALLVSTVVFAMLGLRALRMISEAHIVWAPTLAWGLARAPRRLRAPAGVAAAILAGLSLRLDRAALELHLSPSWNAALLPVRAARFLDEHGIAGPGFNAFRDGGYLEMARPGVPAFIDGRVQAIPDEAWQALQEAERTPAGFQAYLESMGCEWAIATRVRERLGGYRLLNGPRWALIYWDDTSEVFVRRDVARFSALRDSLEYLRFRPYGSIVGAVEKLDREALLELLREIDRFQRASPGDPFALLDRCAALTRLRTPERTEACDEAAARAPPPVARLVERARALQAAP
jgi:hypothetical protein